MIFKSSTKKTLVALSVASSFILAGCQSTASTPSEQPQATVASVVVTPADTGSSAITLEQAMAHPDWLGRQAERAFWAADSKTVVYAQKQQGNELRDLFTQAVNSQAASQVALNKLHTLGAANAVYSADGKVQAYVFEGNVFVKNINTGAITQITHDSAKQSKPQFLTDGNLAYRQGNTFYKVNLATGAQTEIANLHLSDAPKGVTEPETYIAKEQHKLIDYIALTHKNKKDKQARKEQLNQQNSSIADAQFYLGKGNELADVQLSPNGKALIAVVTEARPWRDEADIMPNYIADDARVKAEKVRRRVADEKPQTSQVIYIDLTEQTQTALAFDTLPGFDEDVLAAVKKKTMPVTAKHMNLKNSHVLLT